MDLISKNDVTIMYRTTEDGKKAEYSSIATSICRVDEIKITKFNNINDFIKYAKYSIFSEKELYKEYENKKNYVIKMTHNIALDKRITRHDLIERAGISRDAYFVLLEITKEQFKQICKLGGVNESLIIY